MLRHRREIDGLRAVAVVPVVLFHTGLPLFGGGFVGVDVFFVISGFLITAILLENLSAGSFSLLGFYERRARRILPALFFMMLCCMPFALLWMLPRPLADFSQSLVAAATSTSNILFWLQSGYFAPAAELKPLLHTWSLGVEEQFYLAFPLFLMLLWRFVRMRIGLILVALAVASLALSQWAAYNAPTANFFLAPTRAWELLAGSLCAIWLSGRERPPANEAAAALGLAMIVASVFALDESTPFPSIIALVPVVGTALVLLNARLGTRTARLLSWRPLVGIGLISYSVYLWHQPLLAFARIRLITEPSVPLMLGLAAASLPLGYLSWRYVELPFRGNAPLLPSRAAVFRASAAAVGLLVALGLVGHISRGMPGRIGPVYLTALAAARDRNDRQDACLQKPESFDAELAFRKCSNGVDSNFRVALLGDSHADSYAEPLSEAMREAGIEFTEVVADSCPPFPNLVADTKDCRRYSDTVLPELEEQGVDVVIIAARWTAYAVNSRFDNGEGGVETGPMHPFRIPGTPPSSHDYTPRMLQRFADGVRSYLKDFKVVLVYPSPEAGWNVPDILSKMAIFSDAPSPTLSTDYRTFLLRNRPVTQAFDAIHDPDLFRVLPQKALCDTLVTGRCANAAGGEVFYYDDDHLSNAGARLVEPAIMQAVETIREEEENSDRESVAMRPN